MDCREALTRLNGRPLHFEALPQLRHVRHLSSQKVVVLWTDLAFSGEYYSVSNLPQYRRSSPRACGSARRERRGVRYGRSTTADHRTRRAAVPPGTCTSLLAPEYVSPLEKRLIRRIISEKEVPCVSELQLQSRERKP